MNSTERPPTSTDGPRPRRSPWAVASVAAAVLIAGGGGAYVATSAPDGSTDAKPLPPLALDSRAAPGVAPGIAPGIGPGEPDPNGVVYRAAGELPDGPGSAAVHRPSGTVGAAEVTRLATALGLAGTPRAHGTVWKIGAEKDGGGPLLQVDRQAPGTWTYRRYSAVPGSDNCLKGKPCPVAATPNAPAPGSAASEQAAMKAAAPVLAAVGQSDAARDASQLMGAVRVVNADPVIGGLPTYGWSTGIQVGSDGQVVGGSGKLKAPVKSTEYPVISAEEALKGLNKTHRADIGGCATPVPAESAPCEPKKGTPETRTISKAVFGLAMHAVDGGKSALVPSWLFEVAPQDGAQRHTVTHPAVAPEHLKPAPPAETKLPSPDPTTLPETSTRGVESYAVSADGRTLSLRFWGGVCSDYSARADESGTEVKVKIIESRPDPERVCIMIAKELTEKVTLERPLGERKVVDAASGENVPRA
ncbi:hypothetical protein [Streptomyces sp. NPDC000410]|uniref:hypothetical protein n=1 Tax=Streptomyces sp. NPDC000410 TaxID=3154254 RepID=UPI0033232C84